MSGIVGYIGTRYSVPILLEGLKRLEYRGYDSAGISILNNGILLNRMVEGRVAKLAEIWNAVDGDSTMGIGQTHSENDGDSDSTKVLPYIDCTGKLTLVLSGIIDNYLSLRNGLEANGHQFTTKTDAEVIVHLIEESSKKTDKLESAVRSAISEIEGSFAITVMSQNEPDKLIAVGCGAPLAIGYGTREFFIASDPIAINNYSNRIVFLKNGEIAIVTQNDVYFKSLENYSPLKETADAFNVKV
ncbi:MAG: hypothetical protein ACHQQQ_02320 [Bacteroidota bacterium]